MNGTIEGSRASQNQQKKMKLLKCGCRCTRARANQSPSGHGDQPCVILDLKTIVCLCVCVAVCVCVSACVLLSTSAQVLSCIQSLLVVILQTEPPANDDGSAGPYSVYWDRFSAHVECKRSEGGNLVDRLFDCLDAVAPCTTGCACSSNASSSPLPPTSALVGSWDRGAVLDVASMACCCPSPSSEGDKNREKTSNSNGSSGGGGGGSGVGGRAPNGRIALVEVHQAIQP